MNRLTALLREPLVHFLLVGAGLFGAYQATRDPSGEIRGRIVVSAGQVDQLRARFSRTWLRPPTEEELSGLIDDYVRSEVFYRQALELGLERNDTVIRRRLYQKLEFILEDLTAEAPPSDSVLAAYLAGHPDSFRLPARISFRQIYLNPDRREDLEHDARVLLARLEAGADPSSLGDPTLAGYAFHDVTPDQMVARFGRDFADSVLALEEGAWTGPVYSGLGGHLVQVTDFREGRLPELDAVRDLVERDWLSERRRMLKDQAYEELLQNYEIVIEEPAPADSEAVTRAEADPR